MHPSVALAFKETTKRNLQILKERILKYSHSVKCLTVPKQSYEWLTDVFQDKHFTRKEEYDRSSFPEEQILAEGGSELLKKILRQSLREKKMSRCVH